MKSLIIMTIIAFIFIILSSYFVISRAQYKEQLLVMQNELSSTHKELVNSNELASLYYDNLCQVENRLVEVVGQNELLQDEIDAMHGMIADLKSNEYELIYIGDYKLTHYCCEKRAHICGTGAGITATGTQVTAGRTIAVDPSVIPYGTKVYIEGYGWRVAEDCGGAVKGNHIDVAVDTHSNALSMGTTSGGVWILVKTNS